MNLIDERVTRIKVSESNGILVAITYGRQRIVRDKDGGLDIRMNLSLESLLTRN